MKKAVVRKKFPKVRKARKNRKPRKSRTFTVMAFTLWEYCKGPARNIF